MESIKTAMLHTSVHRIQRLEGETGFHLHIPCQIGVLVVPGQRGSVAEVLLSYFGEMTFQKRVMLHGEYLQLPDEHRLLSSSEDE